MHTIAFPALGIELSINRTAFTIGSLSVQWYGIIIAVGFALAVWYCLRRSVRYEINPDNLIDMTLIATPVAIIGARLYYVVFNWSAFKGDFWSVFKIWEGGIALYGSLIFGLAAAVIYCRIKKISFFNMADLCILGFMIGQIVGRWGNFCNGEAYGQTCENWFLGMSISGETSGLTVHPIFLYESLWNLLGFVILHFISTKRRFYGQTLLMYIVWYGVGRGFIEGIRGDDALMLFDSSIRVSQLLGYLSALVAFGILVYKLLFSDRGDTITLLSREEAAEVRALAKAKVAVGEDIELEDDEEYDEDSEADDEAGTDGDADEEAPDDDNGNEKDGE